MPFDAGYVFDVGEKARKDAILAMRDHTRPKETPGIVPYVGPLWRQLQDETDDWLRGALEI